MMSVSKANDLASEPVGGYICQQTTEPRADVRPLSAGFSYLNTFCDLNTFTLKYRVPDFAEVSFPTNERNLQFEFVEDDTIIQPCYEGKYIRVYRYSGKNQVSSIVKVNLMGSDSVVTYCTSYSETSICVTVRTEW